MIRNRMETFYRFKLNAMSEGYRKRVECMNWLRPCLGAMTLRRMLMIVAVKLRGSILKTRCDSFNVHEISRQWGEPDSVIHQGMSGAVFAV